MLAPIVLFVYNRLEHTKKTIESLKKNILANESDLYIFSDAAKYDSEFKKVEEVRDYIDKIDGFKSVKIIKAENNRGLANSVINGVSKIIDCYGKIIVLEDDLVTSKYFLKYMNEALDIYEKRKDIWSISGYTPNIRINENYPDDVYLTYRGCSWGWATWKNRWENIDWSIEDYNAFKSNYLLRKRFNMSGTDMSPMLDDQMNGRINSWAIRWCYNQFKENKVTVYPIKSYVNNIGTDLSGTHSPITNKYKNSLCDYELKINNDLELDNNILIEFKKFYDLNWKGYLALIVKNIGLYKPARKFRNKFIKFLKK
ncbi:glycosyltransferase family protein [Clostridium perfringens]|uniref:glycosyltransferase n=1 Tax=Clostridium perfringens TaxID=1502 RepID=UPI002AC5788A|nr:glycosyltransferase [Clostridium perfringens]MDZ5065934.1 glycosyltransferase [Clostridium perfringens]